MALDGITTQLLANELSRELTGDRIDKVFMPDKYTIVLHIRGNTMRKLLISFNPSAPRMNITDSTRENPAMPPSFCMLLRKYLSGARIVSIKDPGYERIIEIEAVASDELHDMRTVRLIVELMGRYSNCILVNSAGRIIDSALHVDYSISRVREVMPARIYEYPPAQDKIDCDKALDICLSGSLPIAGTELNRPAGKALLNSIRGLSPLLAGQLCVKADIDDRTSVSLLDSASRERLLSVTTAFLKQVVNDDYKPSVYFLEDDQTGEYSPFELQGFAKRQVCSSLSAAIDLFYRSKDRAIVLDAKRQRLKTIINSALSHVMHKTELHENDMNEGRRADEYKKYGDLILAAGYSITEKSSEFVCTDYYADPPVDITIPLNPALNAMDNAQDYYRRFRKAKRKAELAAGYLEDDRQAIEYFRSLKTAADAAEDNEDIDAINNELMQLSGKDSIKAVKVKKVVITGTGDPNKSVGKAKSGKASSRAMREAAQRATAARKSKTGKSNEKPLSYRKYLSSDGYTILAGRNNIQNDELTFKVADKNDWWFHIKGLPGTHVILKTRPGEDMPSDTAVLEAASTAAYFSKSTLIEEHMTAEGSRPGKIKAEIDYCPVSHVRKIPKARPGMVIYEGYYSVLVDAEEPIRKV